MRWLVASAVAVSIAGPSVGCRSSRRTIRIPDSVVKNPKDASTGRRRTIEPYVIKMSDGQRTWQIEIPASEASGAFAAMVPLNLGEAAMKPKASAPTEADREIKPAAEKPPASAKGEPSTPELSTPVPSYLGTLARVNNLFRRRQYELALIELVALDRAYPDDERILEMKGTLYWKLRRRDLAREAWERVLTLNPNNAAVAQALENLLQEE